MSDLFHPEVPQDFIQMVFAVMRTASKHTFQILTKRSERMVQLGSTIEWPLNVWMGVTVENSDYTYRIDHLKQVGARVKFVSFEPLLGPIPNLALADLDWAIVGGESGPKARPLKKDWVLDIRDQCREASVPFFFKQWGGPIKKRNGRVLAGRTWDEMPESTLRLREAVTSTLGSR